MLVLVYTTNWTEKVTSFNFCPLSLSHFPVIHLGP